MIVVNYVVTNLTDLMTHILDCAKLGADVMTGPLKSIAGLLNHPLTDIGLEKFLADYKKGN